MVQPAPDEHRSRWPLGVGLAIAGAALVALVLAGEGRCDGGTLAPLLLAAVVLGALSVRLPRDAVSLLPGALVPTWLACGADETAAVAYVGALAGGVLGGGLVRAALGSATTLGGVLVGSLAAGALGGPAGALAAEVVGGALGGSADDAPAMLGPLVSGALFAAGYWAGEHLVARAAARWDPDGSATASRSSLVANLLVAFPAVVVVDVLATRGPLLGGFMLVLLVLALALVGLYTGAETARGSAANERERLQSIVSYAPDGIFAVGPDLRVEWLNDAAGRLTGWAPAAAVGRACAEVVPLRQRDGALLDHRDLFLRAARSGAAVHAPALLRGHDGADRSVVASFTAVVGAGDPLGDGFDVGVAALREVEVESGIEEEYRAVQSADLGHELRSPLTAILGYAQMLKSPPGGQIDPSRQEEFAARILSSGDYMLRLVNNLLDLRRMESGVEQIQPEPLNLDALLRTTVGMMKPRAAEKEIALTLVVGPDLPRLVSDELLVRRVLDNLVSNAIKYTPAGGSVRVTAAPERDGIAIAVADTGIGLTEEEQARLFERFFRSGRPEARQERGTGLGLALVREAARRLGGEVRVASAVGEGSTFTFWVPREPPSDGPSPGPATSVVERPAPPRRPDPAA